MSMITLAWGKYKYREKEKEPRIFIAASVSEAPSSSIALFLCLLLGIQLCPVFTHHQRPVNSFRFADILGARHFFSDCMILMVHKMLQEH